MQREGLVTRLRDPQDGRATLVEVTARGRAELLQAQRSVHDRVVELVEALEALDTEDPSTLGMAMYAAAPYIEQLAQGAAQQPHPSPDRTPLTG
jgi:Lon protease-like protein